MPVKARQLRYDLLASLLDGRRIAIRFLHADQMHDQCVEMRFELRVGPIHPLAGMGQSFHVIAVELGCVGLRQIAADRVRLPEDIPVVVNRRNGAVRVHGPVFRRIHMAKGRPAAGDMPVRPHRSARQGKFERHIGLD